MSIKIQCLLSFIPLVNVVPMLLWALTSLKPEYEKKDMFKTVVSAAISMIVFITSNMWLPIDDPIFSTIWLYLSFYLMFSSIALIFALAQRKYR